jgi:hypothetical protein
MPPVLSQNVVSLRAMPELRSVGNRAARRAAREAPHARGHAARFRRRRAHRDPLGLGCRARRRRRDARIGRSRLWSGRRRKVDRSSSHRVASPGGGRDQRTQDRRSGSRHSRRRRHRSAALLSFGVPDASRCDRPLRDDRIERLHSRFLELSRVSRSARDRRSPRSDRGRRRLRRLSPDQRRRAPRSRNAPARSQRRDPHAAETLSRGEELARADCSRTARRSDVQGAGIEPGAEGTFASSPAGFFSC